MSKLRKKIKIIVIIRITFPSKLLQFIMLFQFYRVHRICSEITLHTQFIFCLHKRNRLNRSLFSTKNYSNLVLWGLQHDLNFILFEVHFHRIQHVQDVKGYDYPNPAKPCSRIDADMDITILHPPDRVTDMDIKFENFRLRIRIWTSDWWYYVHNSIIWNVIISIHNHESKYIGFLVRPNSMLIWSFWYILYWVV